jgi:hypothetical protein
MSQRSPYNGNPSKKKGGFYSSGINVLLNRLDKLEHQVFCCGDDTDEVIEVTAATYIIDSNKDGAFFNLNLAAGMTVTLPEATAANVGFNCRIAIKTTFTGTFTLAAGRTADLFEGGVTILDTDTADVVEWFAPDISDDDQLVADADTKGRLVGGFLDIKITAANRIHISGTLQGDGVLATPFA